MKLPKKTPQYMALNENVTEKILPARYLRKDDDGNIIETPEELFQRVAQFVAEPEEDSRKWATEFAINMMELRFVPNTPTLMNAGYGSNQLSACFVISPEDDMEHIFETVKQGAMIQQTGGGVGYSFNKLRPAGHLVSSTKGTASGPVSFMQNFNSMCETVKQGGKRRGAQMAILNVDHPDILRFITSKWNEGDLNNFNISVGITDEFVKAVENDTMITMKFDGEPYYANAETEQFYHDVERGIHRSTEHNHLSFNVREGNLMRLPARLLWDFIVYSAWKNGEPGLFYIDEANREHTFDVDKYPEYAIEATNPCGEQPLVNFESCNLAHINLSVMVHDSASVYDGSMSVESYIYSSINMDLISETVDTGVRFLDNVVDMSEFPLDEITQQVRNLRKIGLGIMGFHQMLMQMGIPYDSDDAVRAAEVIMELVDHLATLSSHELAKEKGPFPAWHDSKYADPLAYPEWFMGHTGLDPHDYPDGFVMRNHNVTTIAPTGTTAMIGDTSYGCEPIFSVVNYKNVGKDIRGDDRMVEFDSYFREVLIENGIDVDEIKTQAEYLMANNKYEGVHSLDVPSWIADIFVCANEVSYEQHIRIQQAMQSVCDSGVSKTINMDNTTTLEDVSGAYMQALTGNNPVKGLTVYRDGSRNEQVLTTRNDNKLDTDESEATERCSCGGIYIETDGCKACVECGSELCSI